MKTDTYSDLAEKYNYLLSDNPNRIAFFKNIFARHKVKTLLDCSCGTGADLIRFQSFVDKVTGSDLSNAMLAVARRKIEAAGRTIDVKKAGIGDYTIYGDWDMRGYEKLDGKRMIVVITRGA